jgi:hypothetical protein
MSRGPGRIERLIEAEFKANSSGTFTVDELASLAYAGAPVAKKHRVSVIRAARKAALRAHWTWVRGDREKLVYCNALNHRSYALAKLRAEYNNCLPYRDDWSSRVVSLEQIIDDPTARAHYYECVHGQWRKEVEVNQLRHAGEHDKAQLLQDELDRERSEALARALAFFKAA